MANRDLAEHLIHTLGRTLRPKIDDERTFLGYQIELRAKAGPILNECMLVLDIIDTKTGSLLQYISIALAILLFAFGMISGKDFKISDDTQSILSVLILLNVIISVVAIVLCLSCINIVGAHTVFELERDDYETHMIAVTLGRRNRYRLAHRLSMVTAISLLAIFSILALNYTTIFSNPGFSPFRGLITVTRFLITITALTLPILVMFAVKWFRPMDLNKYPGWYIGCAASFAASLSWGIGNYVTAFTAHAYSLHSGLWPDLEIAFYNYLGGVTAIGTVILLRMRRQSANPRWNFRIHWGAVVILGLGCIVLKSANTILFVLSTSIIKASTSALLENAQVLWIGLALAVFTQTKRRGWILAACAGAFASIFVILRADHGPIRALGLALGIGSGIAYALFISGWVRLQRKVPLTTSLHTLLLLCGTFILLALAGPGAHIMTQHGHIQLQLSLPSAMLQIANGTLNVGLTYFLVAFAGQVLRQIGSLGLVIVSFGLSYSIIVTQMVEDLFARRAPSIQQTLGSLMFSICFVILRYACEPRIEAIDVAATHQKHDSASVLEPQHGAS